MVKEYDGEMVCMDMFDSLMDDSKTISTRVAVGLSDSATWDSTKKQLSENPQSAINISDPKSQAYQQSLHLHNILMQNVQTDLVVTRLDYIESSSTPNYDYINQEFKLNLACKFLVFDFNFGLLQGKSKKNKKNFFSKILF